MIYDHASYGSLVHYKVFRTKLMQYHQLGTMRIGLKVGVFFLQFLTLWTVAWDGHKPNKKMEML